MLGCCQGWLIYLLLMLVHVEIQVHLRQSASWLKMCVLSLSGLQVRIYFLQYCINTVKCCCVFTSKLCLLQNNVSFITNNDCNRSCGSIMLKKKTCHPFQCLTFQPRQILVAWHLRFNNGGTDHLIVSNLSFLLFERYQLIS